MASKKPINVDAVRTLRQQVQVTDSAATRHEAEEINRLVKEETRREERRKKRRFAIVTQRVRLTHLMVVMDNLSTMLAAGLRITDALTILAEEIKHKFLKRILLEVRHGIELGKAFSEELEQYPHVFSPLLIATIRVGEVSGTLSNVLASIAEMARRENRLKRKVLGAMMYPTVVVFAMIVVGIVMLTYVFPQIISVFVESNIKLPIQIVIVSSIGKAFELYGSLIIGGVLLFILAVYFLLKVRVVRKVVDRWALKVPLLGTQIIKGTMITRITANLHTMLVSGLPIVEGVNIISHAIGNLEYKDQLKIIAHELEVGRSIHEAFASRPHLFPPIVIQLIKVGEETGKLDDVLQKLSAYYDEKVDDILSNLSTIIEPVLLLIVGVLVGFMAVSIIGPIYELANAI